MIIAIIDTRVIGNFIDIYFTRRELEILVTRKRPYRLNMINGDPADNNR